MSSAWAISRTRPSVGVIGESQLGKVETRRNHHHVFEFETLSKREGCGVEGNGAHTHMQSCCSESRRERAPGNILTHRNSCHRESPFRRAAKWPWPPDAVKAAPSSKVGHEFRYTARQPQIRWTRGYRFLHHSTAQGL